MDLIVQKAVELGAYSIIPVEMKRCVVRLDAKKAQKKQAKMAADRRRWCKAVEKDDRSKGRAGNVLQRSFGFCRGRMDLCLIPYENAKGMEETRQILSQVKPGMSVGIFIGPEGGLEKEEVQLAMEHGARQITLGHRILRTETAGMAILSVLMFQLEER